MKIIFCPRKIDAEGGYLRTDEVGSVEYRYITRDTVKQLVKQVIDLSPSYFDGTATLTNTMLGITGMFLSACV